MEAKKWMEAFGEIRESYLEEAMETGRIAAKRKKRRWMSWCLQYASVFACICILVAAIAGGVLKHNQSGTNQDGPKAPMSSGYLVTEEAEKETACPEDIEAVSKETTSPAMTQIAVTTSKAPEAAEEKVEADIALPEGAFFVNMTGEEIALIWGQKTLYWEDLCITEEYLLEGQVLYNGSGNVRTVTIYGYANETAKAETDWLFMIELASGEMPPVCEIYEGTDEIWQVHGNNVKVRVSELADRVRYEAAFSREFPAGIWVFEPGECAQFEREEDEHIGVRAVFRIPKGEPDMKDTLIRPMLSQSLDPEETLQLVLLKTRQTPDVRMNDFTMRLFGQLVKDGENILISPMSVSAVLAMTANGAEGETKAQMENLLDLSLNSLNQYFYDYQNSLLQEETQNMYLANSIWIKDENGFSVEDDFIETVRAWYGAEVFEEIFDSETAEKLNDWVSEHTNEMIPEILDEIPDDAKMYLMNAIAFDAQWRSPYSDAQVREGHFTMKDGEEKKVDFMYSREYSYLRDEHAEGFLKYYDNMRYAFAALLPEEGLSVEEYAASLTGEKLYRILSNQKHRAVKTAIPRFESGSEYEMSEVLQAMGMTDAFDSVLADFSGIGSAQGEGLKINRIVHQTAFSLNEKGTRAGAVTMEEIAPTSAAPAEDEKEIYLDRPFLYMIVDCDRNIPIFIGILNQP